MEKSTAKAMARQVRISPMKVRQVLALIRGKDAGEALTILRFSPQKAARIVYKVLQSAVANAEHNYGMDTDKLQVVTAFADQGVLDEALSSRLHGQSPSLCTPHIPCDRANDDLRKRRHDAKQTHT